MIPSFIDANLSIQNKVLLLFLVHVLNFSWKSKEVVLIRDYVKLKQGVEKRTKLSQQILV